MTDLPWDRRTGPHCVLEITRDCNLDFQSSYRRRMPGFLSVEEVLVDL